MMFRASAKSVGIIHALVLVAGIVGAFFVEWSVLGAVVLVASYYFINSICIAMMMHRYWTHKSFEFRWSWLKWVLTIASCLPVRGSPLAWVYIHRLHHTHSDTDKDPHSPHNIGYSFFGLSRGSHTEQMKIFMVKELLSKKHIFLNDYYLLIVAVFVVLLAIISPQLLYFMWVVPVALTQLSQDAFNYFAHTSGYRNSQTRDHSTNNPLLWPLILGEAWHNNHHADPKNATTAVKWWELDPLQHIIKIVS